MGKINNNDLSLQFLRLGCMRQAQKVRQAYPLS